LGWVGKTSATLSAKKEKRQRAQEDKEPGRSFVLLAEKKVTLKVGLVSWKTRIEFLIEIYS